LGCTASTHFDLPKKVRVKVAELNESRRSAGLHDISKEVLDQAATELIQEFQPLTLQTTSHSPEASTLDSVYVSSSFCHVLVLDINLSHRL
jgi:hypothetical protein